MNELYYAIEQEKANVDFCREVASFLDTKFTRENSKSSETEEQEGNDVFNPQLDDTDLQLITDFIISWCSRKCDCLIKQHCDKLPILIQTYLHYVPTVLTAIWRQLLLLDETSTNQEVRMFGFKSCRRSEKSFYHSLFYFRS